MEGRGGRRVRHGIGGAIHNYLFSSRVCKSTPTYISKTPVKSSAANGGRRPSLWGEANVKLLACLLRHLAAAKASETVLETGSMTANASNELHCDVQN